MSEYPPLAAILKARLSGYEVISVLPPDNQECMICLRSYNTVEGQHDPFPPCIPIKLHPCGHIVGQYCFDKHINGAQAPRCLYCRRKLLLGTELTGYEELVHRMCSWQLEAAGSMKDPWIVTQMEQALVQQLLSGRRLSGQQLVLMVALRIIGHSIGIVICLVALLLVLLSLKVFISLPVVLIPIWELVSNPGLPCKILGAMKMITVGALNLVAIGLMCTLGVVGRGLINAPMRAMTVGQKILSFIFQWQNMGLIEFVIVAILVAFVVFCMILIAIFKIMFTVADVLLVLGANSTVRAQPQ